MSFIKLKKQEDNFIIESDSLYKELTIKSRRDKLFIENVNGQYVLPVSSLNNLYCGFEQKIQIYHGSRELKTNDMDIDIQDNLFATYNKNTFYLYNKGK